ncbi:MAG TPA: bifunctional DedA family/phosphatase PAP2 family protein [Solirubrobacterales bacterium]|jgi:undecaprenyl-diphosphatase|nr:bifunctional DedA family/phosphatase PAP2 family protein [Solirubrobacterales bacterium]
MKAVLRDHRVRLALIVAAAVAIYFLVRQLLPEIRLQELLDDVSNALGAWTYLLIGVFAFLETGAFVGLVAPGETVVILGGAVAGQGATSLYLTIAIVWACAWAGDSVSFMIGRRLGRGFVLRHGSRVRITPERFEQVESYFSRHGGKTILIGRFVGLVRALAPFIAGSSGMRYRMFVPYSILGTGLWAATFALIGYFAARSLDRAAELAGRGTFLFGTVVVTVVVIVVAVRFLRQHENRVRLVAAMERRPLLRPLVALGRRVQPQARFLRDRLTPGGLGLEFTGLLAALSIGLYTLIAYTVVISGDPGPTPGDMTAHDVARELNAAWLVDAADVLTALGSLPAVLAVALVAGIALAANRRWPELAVLVAAVAITIVAVHGIKDAVERPRPPNGAREAEGYAFPSGHAAYSVIYAWLAITVVARLRPGLTNGTALIAAGIALTVLVGLTRVYLGVHYLSDVVSGWGLGVSAFSACAAVAVVATHLRQNARNAG